MSSDTVTLTFDGLPVRADRDQTVLDAARQNGVYIPTLCAHKDLTPFGGCRMCIVEIEGRRGYPTACTTPVEDGLVVRTQTAGLQAERNEILQLILSEHPMGCLLCEERGGCREFTGTLHKAGVTSGCGNCPKDTQCELQDVVAWVGITEMKYPVRYRGLRVEKEDPFFDRDYNLCILCGRCVRACQDLRIAGTLAFKQRGPAMIIGPAFGRTHMEAGCEFCGTCVTVCPTGALADKAGKWEGKSDRETVTTCPLCGLGCQLKLRVKHGKVIGVVPVGDGQGIANQLCVKGRFSVTELVNGHERLAKPYHLHEATRMPLTWEEAAALAAEKLAACPPEKFGMVISADSTNEDLYVAQKFARTVMKGQRIDTPARLEYGAGFAAYARLLARSVKLEDLASAGAILAVGADLQFGASVVGSAIKKALRKDARLVTVHPRDHHLVRVADRWLQPVPGTEITLLEELSASLMKPNGAVSDVAEAAGLLRSGTPLVIVVGTEFLSHPDSARLLEALMSLADRTGAGILPIVPQGNLAGSLQMGAFPELMPGGSPSPDGKAWNSASMAEGDLQVLYVIGDVPVRGTHPAEFVIAQNIYPPETHGHVHLVLPSAAFTEVDGSLIASDGRVAELRKAVNAPGEALPDWKIICTVARAMGAAGFDYADAAEIRREIAHAVPGFDFGRILKWNGTARFAPASNGNGHREPARTAPEYAHRGFALTDRVEGLKALVSAPTEKTK